MRAGLAVLLAVFASNALAVTIRVGPTRPVTQLSAVPQGTVMPGDVIELDGNATYQAVRWTRSGTAASPIRIVGLRVSGNRPRLMDGTNTLEVQADHVIVEGLELTGGTARCFYHHGDDVTLRDSVVHDCPAHGVLGADQDSGSLLMEFVEVYRTGNGTFEHQVYMATDELAHPGSVFRMRYCFLHDANGGNNVKSRAQRNEIHFNWIEGAMFHELELIGPDPNGAAPGWTIDTAREDSEVVGNVLRKTRTTFVARLGGDSTGWSKGRYRFVNNTVIVQPGGSAVFRLFDELESVEMHNNVFTVDGSGSVNLLRADQNEMRWVGGTRRVSGTNNWVRSGAANTPAEWVSTVTGADPGFAMLASFDVRPQMGSPLVNAGAATFPSPPGATFPNPLPGVTAQPPRRGLTPGTIDARPVVGLVDIGAFEFGVGTAGGSAGGGSAGGGSTGGGSAGGGSTGGGSAGGGSAGGGSAGGGSAGGGSAGGGSAGGGSTSGGSTGGGSTGGGSDGSAAGGATGATTSPPTGCGCASGPQSILLGLALLLIFRARSNPR